jgi:hypothetical protein
MGPQPPRPSTRHRRSRRTNPHGHGNQAHRRRLRSDVDQVHSRLPGVRGLPCSMTCTG